MRVLCNILGEEQMKKKINDFRKPFAELGKKNQCWEISAPTLKALGSNQSSHFSGRRNRQVRATDCPSIKGEGICCSENNKPIWCFRTIKKENCCDTTI